MKNETQKANRKLTWQLWLFAAGFLAFGFALVPLYNVLCDITGYGDRTKLRQAASVVEAPDESRTVTIELISSVPTLASTRVGMNDSAPGPRTSSEMGISTSVPSSNICRAGVRLTVAGGGAASDGAAAGGGAGVAAGQAAARETTRANTPASANVARAPARRGGSAGRRCSRARSRA